MKIISALMVAAAFLSMTGTAFAAEKTPMEPKELYVVSKVGHVDLYDNPEYLPFDKLTAFFNENLK